ncbi:PIR protein [Plasmodium ovale]|uniref:PIR protein n=1 Tax=Plasmodium ovale TaxID=36330 RepID=A0A1C3KJF5_PLAOA|nr:PIR protein [Plasmodium ovale]
MEREGSQGGLGELSQTYSSNLPSKIFYNDMKKEYPDLSKYSKQCDINIVDKNIDDIKNICKRILRYLENNRLLIDNKTQYDVCVLLNYWIHDALTEIFGPANTSDNITSAFYILDQMWKHPNEHLKRTNYYNKCQPNFDIFKNDDWKKRKELYEYYVDYSTLHGTAKSYIPQCETYYNKIEEKKSIYEYFDQLCISKPDKCPDFYQNCKNYNPKLVLHELSCHGDILAKRSAAAAAAPERSDATHHPSGQYQEFGNSALISENSEIGTKVGHSVLGVAPFLLTATALYRYTPIGTWIRKLGGTNPNSMNNINEAEMNGFFSDSENYISYHPM